MTLLEDSKPELRSLRTRNLPVYSGIYQMRVLEQYTILLHGVSTRTSPDGEDWNLSARRSSPQQPTSLERALANRKKLAERLGISLDRIVGCQQVHGSEVAIARASDGGRGMYPDRPSIQGTDALVSNTPGLYLMALSADCPSVFFYDPVRQAVGLAHSGWKGTVGRIASNVVETMVDNFGSDPTDIIAAVGPGIGPCCYSVGQDVVEAVEGEFCQPWEPEARGWGSGARGGAAEYAPVLELRDCLTYFNLREGIRQALLDAGIPEQSISIEGVCTGHNLDVFYSHRLEKGQCGLFGAVLGLREG